MRAPLFFGLGQSTASAEVIGHEHGLPEKVPFLALLSGSTSTCYGIPLEEAIIVGV
jgi:hypothetical protein